jgi:RNA polymerase sigma factor (sigma-70 family)
MSTKVSGSLVRQIEALFDGSSVAGLSDRQLLDRFTAQRDAAAESESAFAALVLRHGPLVLGVCTEMLNDRHHAEDAFQAVFLILARKAHSIRDADLLGNWLYGVALRTCRHARHQLDRRRKNEEVALMLNAASRVAAPSAEEVFLIGEQGELLHNEIERLPRAFRLPVVLCYLQGLTVHEAARRLRCSHGTLRSRMARAREKLKRALTRRGVVLPAAGVAASLSARYASASVSSHLCEMTARAAIRFAAGASTAPLAAALAQDVLRSMFATKLKLTVLSTVLISTAAAGAGYTNHLLATEEERMTPPPARTPHLVARNEPPPPAADSPSTPGRLTVSGRVLDAAGKPASGAPIDLVGVSRTPAAGTDVEKDAFVLLGQATADAEGRFRIDPAGVSSARFLDVYILAGAPGPSSGFGCLRVHPDAGEAALDLRLRPEQLIRGRLVDLSGEPAAGVEVSFNRVLGVSPLPGGADFDGFYPGFGYVWSVPPRELRAWPKAVMTDAQGQFTLPGIGRGLSVVLFVRDPRFAQQRFDFQAADRDAAKEVTLALHPATRIEGCARASDTGRPIAGAVISVRASFGSFGGMFTTKFRADDQGRFKISPYSGDYFRMRVFPPEGQPYLARELEFAWTKGAVKKDVDLTLPRGVLVHGKVTERGTGRPVAGASVQFVPIKPPPDIIDGFEAIVRSKDDGSFQVAVPPGKGHLMIVGPTLDFIPQQLAGGKLYASGQPGGWRFYAHDIIAYDCKAGESSLTISSTLNLGKTLRGRVAGPSGEEVQHAVILNRQQLDPVNLTWLTRHHNQADHGRFELHGFDPDEKSPAYFLDAAHRWGAAVEFSGKQAGEELTVRLEPCGQARARFVGPDGKPVVKLDMELYFKLIMTPGPAQTGSVDRGSQLAADETWVAGVDPKHYQPPHGPVTDSEGRITLPDLIPGAPYRIVDWSLANDPKGLQIRKDFTVKPGETRDLGDILVEKPQTR